MKISKDLLLAILSLDSYNHGYGEGIGGLGSEGDFIGPAKILKQSDTETGSLDVAAGFYAIAYQVPDVGSVISYRGTDFAPTEELTKDIAQGWAFGGGDFRAYQLNLSTAFLQSVVETPDVDSKDDIILTGHSLGGGLAGFNSHLYDIKAVVDRAATNDNARALRPTA